MKIRGIINNMFRPWKTLKKTIIKFYNKLTLPAQLDSSNNWIIKARDARRITAAEMQYTRVGTLIVATIYLQLIQNRYMFRSFTVLHCSHQHCVQPVASDVEVVGYL